jgi:hypothetical protein
MPLTSHRLLALGVLALASSATSATVLNFDDITQPGFPAAVRGFFEGPYNGVTFGVIPTSDPAFKQGGSWFWSRDVSALANSPSTSVSTESPVDGNGVPILGAANQQSARISATGGTFVFSGAYFKALRPMDLRFHLYLNDTDIWQSAFVSLPGNPAGGPATFLASGYSGLVDAVTVEGYQSYFAMDDFSFTAVPTPVPEPASLALVALALGGLLAAARRRPGPPSSGKASRSA